MATSLYTIEDDKLRLNLHAGQTRAWDSPARIIAVIAGSQGGKTSFGGWWLWREILACGAGDYLAVTSSFDLFKLKMLPEIRNIFEHVLGIGRYWSGDKIIELRNPDTGAFEARRADDPMWGRIILRSAQARGGLESATAKAGWGDEVGQDEFTLEAYEGFRRRLTLHRGRLLLTTTPYNLGWLYQQIVQKPSEQVEIVHFRSIDNPSFSREEYAELKATMPDWKFRMFHEGVFERPPGLIYGDFINKYRESGGHKVKPFAIPNEWPRVVGIDPGAVNLAMAWWAHDTDNDIWYLYRESLGGGKSTPEHAHEATALVQVNNERVIGWYIGSKGEVQQRLDWDRAGVSPVYEPPVADVDAGIDRIIRLLRQHRFYVFDTCVGTLDQFGRYARVLDGQGNTTDKIKDKDTYHYLDANRYAAAGIDAPRERSELW